MEPPWIPGRFTACNGSEKRTYQIPAYGCRMFAGAIAQLRRGTAREVIVLDLRCSFGTDGALLNHDVGLDALSGNVRGPLGAAEYGP